MRHVDGQEIAPNLPLAALIFALKDAARPYYLLDSDVLVVQTAQMTH